MSEFDAQITATGSTEADTGTFWLPEHLSFWWRPVMAMTLGVPAVFAGVAVIRLFQVGLTLSDLVTFLVMYVVTILGQSIGYHRLLAHRSFTAPRWLRLTLAVMGGMALAGPVVQWVAQHRRHHAYSDRHGDPHSPYLIDNGKGVRAALRRFWHAHAGWLFRPQLTSVERWAPDLASDPAMVAIERLFPLIVLLGLALPTIAVFAVTRSGSAALGALLWGGMVRIFVVQQLIMSINSLGHIVGGRPYRSHANDQSTNFWPIALLSFGDSWHNNHHAFPTSYRHGLAPWQIDLSAAIIYALECVGLVRDVKRPELRHLQRKQRS